jgi:hypothetical protein
VYAHGQRNGRGAGKEGQGACFKYTELINYIGIVKNRPDENRKETFA